MELLDLCLDTGYLEVVCLYLILGRWVLTCMF